MAGINFENEQEYYSKPLKFNNGYAAVVRQSEQFFCEGDNDHRYERCEEQCWHCKSI